MNNESSEASPQQQPESASDTKPIEPAPHSQDASEGQPIAAQGAPDVPADESGNKPEGSLPAPVGGDAAETPPATPAPADQTPHPAHRKIQIGRKRPPVARPLAKSDESKESKESKESAEPTDDQPTDDQPAVEEPEYIEPPQTGPVPTPSVHNALPPDLEAELEAAIGDASLDEMLANDASVAAGAPIELESRLKSAVTRIHGDNVFFSLGGRNEGVASLRQFTEPPSLGDELEVIAKSYLAEDGLYELVVPGASSRVDDWDDLVEGMVVEARVTGSNTGGLECKVGGLRGFIPSSQIAMFRVEDYAEFIDQKLLCVVTEANPNRKNLVLSRRAVLEREKEEERKRLLESLEVGHVAEGTVRKLMDFGAFVDIGGVDGLVHISQMSWDRVNDPSEVLEVGQVIRVKIEKIDEQTGKIGLSYRDLLDHPWLNIEEDFPVDTIAKGTVSRIAKFGAFVKLAAGVEGLIHISELSHGRVQSVGAVVSEGQDVDVKVLSVDSDAQRIGLSMKAVIPEPQEVAEDTGKEDEAMKAQREKLAAQRTKPLKGGIGRDSGGGQFGLKW